MGDDVSDERVRQWTQRLIDKLRIEHPEQEYEPEGLQIRDEIDLPIIESSDKSAEQRKKDAYRRRLREARKAKGKPNLLTTVRTPESDILDQRNEVINRVAVAHDLHATDIISRKRHPDIIKARKEIYRELRAMKWSWPSIGRAMGRHYSTVMSGAQAR